MKSTGIVRQIDDLGRIVLPKELRKVMQIDDREPIEIFLDEESLSIALRKYHSQECSFCQATDQVYYFRKHFICYFCLQELNQTKEDLKVGLECASTVEKSPIKDSQVHFISAAKEREPYTFIELTPEDLTKNITPKEEKPRIGRRPGSKTSETIKLLEKAMRQKPYATQSTWAEMIGVSPSRISQLIRQFKLK